MLSRAVTATFAARLRAVAAADAHVAAHRRAVDEADDRRDARAFGCRRSPTSPRPAARCSRLTPQEAVIDVRRPVAVARASSNCNHCQTLKP
jgi:hypothetical protein